MSLRPINTPQRVADREAAFMLAVVLVGMSVLAVGATQGRRLRAVGAVNSGQQGSDPLPDARRADWTYAGVPGGIPTRTRCTTGTGTSLLGSSSTATQINTAITGCDANHFVELGSGTFSSLGGTINLTKSSVSLKGQGANSTILVQSGTNAIVSMVNSEASDVTGRTITAGGTKGTFTITVSSTTGLTVGKMIAIDRADDTTYVQASLATARKVSQVNVITAVNGLVLTVRNPWAADFSAGSPAVKFGYTAFKTGIGLEDVKLSYGGGSAGTLYMWFCDSCWIKGIDSSNLLTYHILLMGTVNSEVRDAYIHGGGSGSNGGGVIFEGDNTYGGNSHDKLENTIIDNIFPALEVNNGVAIAVLYNYVHGNPASLGVTHSLDDSHAQETVFSLYEGNISETWGQDGYHGGAAYATAHRNWITGYNPNSADGGDAVQIKRLGYFYNMLGNVIGNTIENPGTYQTGCGSTNIYQFGYPNIGNCLTVQDPGNGAQTSGLSYPDTGVTNTLARWGNYDTFTDTTQWSTSETPADFGDPATQTLLNSYIYTVKPAFFHSGDPWPGIGPDVSGGTGPGGKAYSNPAFNCWSAGLNVGGAFSAATCY